MPPEFKIDPEVLQFLRCPVTQTALQIASPEIVAEINSRIVAGNQVNRLGEAVRRELDGGLVNEDGSILLPVRGGIFNLVVDQAIDVESAVQG